jgi:REP element-mobilizing transposase RayT
MARGINGQKLFHDKKDLDRFLDRLEALFLKSDHTCYDWALMNNHFHLLVKSGDETLSSLMRRLLTGHAVYFNRRHKRFGHLFQNRFKSILCQEDTYFLQRVRYIHLNPLRTGMVKTMNALNQYRYTGHAYLLGELKNTWQDTQTPLKWFGKQKQRSQQKYFDYVKEGITEGRREDLTGGGVLRTAGGWKGLRELKRKGQGILGDERMLGDSAFVEEALKTVDTAERSPQLFPENDSLDRLSKDVSRFFHLKPADVKSPSKQRHLKPAKSMICYIAVRLQKVKGIEVAEHLQISQSAVSKLVTQYHPDAAYDSFIAEQIKF